MSDHRDSLPCRRFNLGDGMLMIAAIAVGLALGKRVLLESVPRHPIAPAFRWFYALVIGHNAAYFNLEMLSVALMIMRVRRPRPPLIRAMNQPGAIACGTAVVLPVLFGIVVVYYGSNSSLSSWAFVLSLATGTSVAGVWMTVWLNRWWRREIGWIDGMGRFLGVCWLVLPLVELAAFL